MVPNVVLACERKTKSEYILIYPMVSSVVLPCEHKTKNEYIFKLVYHSNGRIEKGHLKKYTSTKSYRLLNLWTCPMVEK